MSRALPNLIIAGVQKGATTALYDWLSQHPDVFGDPAMKDFPYFCEGGYKAKGLDWFAERFSDWNDETVILHGYVHYLFLAEETAPELIAFNKDIRLLIVLRNPVDRAFSGYLQARNKGHESCETFEEAIEDDLGQKLDDFKSLTNRSYISHGFYSRQLETLFKYIPRENVKIMNFDDVNHDPERTCRECFEFIGVNTSFKPDFVRKNDYGVPRSPYLQRLIAGALFSKTLRDLVPINLRIRIRHKLHELNTRRDAKPRLSPETRAQLQAIYADEIPRIAEISGLDLSDWS
ncbi:MAG: hypothetical protein HKN56_10970 [Gammaproteobacteria bacterium]|nr:hypothetical protein [Gammaproteobacteria bacterium]